MPGNNTMNVNIIHVININNMNNIIYNSGNNNMSGNNSCHTLR
jgi:hypothetical protein